MKSVLLGILAALVGCAIFFACLVGWYELTGQGSGIFSQRAAAETDAAPADANAGVTIVAPGTASGQSDGAGTENNAQTTVPLIVIPEDVTADASDVSPGQADSGATQGTAPGGQEAETPEHLLEAFAEKIEKELSPALGEGGHVRVASAQGVITVTLWEDDLVSRLTAGQASGETQQIWDEMHERLRSLTLTYHDRRAEEGVPDARVVANLINEQQQNDIILSYEDGNLIHDGLDHD